MSGFDLDDSDEQLTLPRDKPDPCSCTASCQNNRCTVSSECKVGAYRDRLFGFIPYGPSYKPCVDEPEEVMREAHRARIHERTGAIIFADKEGGASTQHNKAGGWGRTSMAKQNKHNAGNYEYYVRHPYGHTYRVANPYHHYGYNTHYHAHQPRVYHHYAHYGYPQYYHLASHWHNKHRHQHKHRHSKSKSRSHTTKRSRTTKK